MDKTDITHMTGRLVATGKNDLVEYKLRRVRPLTQYGLQYALWARIHKTDILLNPSNHDKDQWALIALVATATAAYKITEAAQTKWTNDEFAPNPLKSDNSPKSDNQNKSDDSCGLGCSTP